MKIFDDIKNLITEFRTRMAELAQEEQNLRRTIARQAETLDDQRVLISDQRKAIDKLNECKPEWVPSIAALLGLPWAPDFFAVRQAIEALIKERDQLRAQLDHAALQLGGRNPSPMGPQIKIEPAYPLALEDQRRQLADQLDHAMQLLGQEQARTDAVLTDLAPTSPDLAPHVRTLLGILDATGGYLPTDYQAAIRAAREAVRT